MDRMTLWLGRSQSSTEYSTRSIHTGVGYSFVTNQGTPLSIPFMNLEPSEKWKRTLHPQIFSHFTYNRGGSILRLSHSLDCGRKRSSIW